MSNVLLRRAALLCGAAVVLVTASVGFDEWRLRSIGPGQTQVDVIEHLGAPGEIQRGAARTFSPLHATVDPATITACLVYRRTLRASLIVYLAADGRVLAAERTMLMDRLVR